MKARILYALQSATLSVCLFVATLLSPQLKCTTSDNPVRSRRCRTTHFRSFLGAVTRQTAHTCDVSCDGEMLRTDLIAHRGSIRASIFKMP
jgi:hypothetical protein